MPFHFYADDSPAVALPHPAISLSVFLILEEALRVAWGILRERSGTDFDLLNSTEDIVTHKFYEVLLDEVFERNIVSGFNKELFAAVTREAKIRNFDGKHLDKMPDLLVGLVDRPTNIKRSQDWLFIECKPVDSDHSVGVHYCDKGLLRFIQGDYAWTMKNALMVAYVRGDYSISSKLKKALEERAATIPTLEPPLPCKSSSAKSFSEIVQLSKHKRTFSYVETGKPAPEISMRHLWLKRD